VRSLQPVKRAVGIVRVSRVGKRSREKFVSPEDQTRQIERVCERNHLDLVEVTEELDVSGFSRSIDRRPGLSHAINMIESGQAEVLVVAYFDRLCRRLAVKEEVFRRMSTAGAGVIALDMGDRVVDGETTGEWLDLSFRALMAEYQARQIRDRTRGPTERAVKAGIPPFAHIPPGYRRGPDRRVVVEEAEAAAVLRAFEMRDEGVVLREIRDYLRSHGIVRDIRGVQGMLSNRIYLGELHFGKLVNLSSHTPIIDPSLFRRVQPTNKRGPRTGRSGLLLARLGILRCSGCGRGLVAGSQVRRGGRYRDYRCPTNMECAQRVAISTSVADAAIDAYMLEIQQLGQASNDDLLSAAETRLAEADRTLREAINLLTDYGEAARPKLDALQAERDEAETALSRLRAGSRARGVSADWRDLGLAERRAWLRAEFLGKVVYVHKARRGVSPTERLSVELLVK
jgi:site-specific DNA recombinase